MTLTTNTVIELKIYVPRPPPAQPPGDECRLVHILRGSGIVGSPHGPGIRIDYEGNRHGASNIETWEDKVLHAAGRHVKHYPTSARAYVTEENLIEVGVFRCDDNWKDATCEINDAETLRRWKGPG
jgi:hypothetical protein